MQVIFSPQQSFERRILLRQRFKCIHNVSVYIFYLANPGSIGQPETKGDKNTENSLSIKVQLSQGLLLPKLCDSEEMRSAKRLRIKSL